MLLALAGITVRSFLNLYKSIKGSISNASLYFLCFYYSGRNQMVLDFLPGLVSITVYSLFLPVYG